MNNKKNAILVGGLASCTAVMALSAGPATANNTEDSTQRFIVQVEQRSDLQSASRALSERMTQVDSLRGKAFNGLVVEGPAGSAEDLRQLPGVTHVERDQPVTADSQVQSWGIDRIDQRDLPMDGSFNTPSDGTGTHIFVIDTGVTETSILSGRVGNGIDLVDPDTSPEDCHGHGTHVAGTAAGSNGYGVAPGATVHSVRVLDCNGSGWTTDVLAGINWVAANAPTASVANTSLGGRYSQSVNAAVDALYAAGTPLATAAGNSWDDACDFSPASAMTAVTTAASTLDTSGQVDELAWFSNFGSCIDLAAPGENITSMLPDGSVDSWDGTSMASPHVAGVMATFYARNPGASAQAGVEWVKSSATEAKVDGYDLLFASSDFGAPDTNAPAPVSGLVASSSDSSVTLTWSNPTDQDLDSILVRRQSGSTAPTSPEDGIAVVLPTPTASTVTDAGLAPGTQYSYAVFTKDLVGNVNPTGSNVSVSTSQAPKPPNQKPGAVQVSVVKVGKHYAKLSWASVERALTYAVASRKANRAKWIAKGSTAGTVLRVKRLKGNSRYTLRVTASNEAGSGAPAVVKVRTKK